MAVDARRLPRAAIAHQLGGDLLELALRAEDEMVDARADRQRDRRSGTGVAERFLDDVLAIEARGMDIGAPTAGFASADAAGEVAASDQQPSHLQPPDLLPAPPHTNP